MKTKLTIYTKNTNMGLLTVCMNEKTKEYTCTLLSMENKEVTPITREAALYLIDELEMGLLVN